MPADFLLRNTSTGALMILSGDTPLDAAALVDAGTYKVRALSAEAGTDLVIPVATPGTGVDYRADIWGQSELANLYGTYENPETGETVLADNVVTFWWSNRNALGSTGTPAEEVRSHVMTAADGYNSRFVRMANAWIRQNPGKSIAIVFHTKGGRNFDELVDDSLTAWHWPNDVALNNAVAAAYGGKVADLVHFDWQGSPSTYGGDYGKALHQILFGETFDGTSIGPLPATIVPGHSKEFTADHLLSELYDWSNPNTKISVLEPHRFEANPPGMADVRGDIRRMYAQSVHADKFVRANAILSYRNGKDEGGIVADSSHPSSGEGSRRYGEGQIQAIMQALGLRPQPHVEIDNAYWDPNGEFVEVWSSHGPIRTIDGAPAGMKINGAFFDGEITPQQRLRVTSTTFGRQFNDTDTLEFLPISVGQTGAYRDDPAANLAKWVQMPLVRTPPGAMAIPEDARAGAIIATTNGELESAIENATGGEHIIVPAGTDIGDLRVDNATPASEVTIWSDGIGAARLSHIEAYNCSNLTFRNFMVERAWDAGSNIVVGRSVTNFFLFGNTFRSSKYPHGGVDYDVVAVECVNGIDITGNGNANIRVEGNYIGGMKRSLAVQADGVHVINNFAEDAYEDHFRISNPSDPTSPTVIRGNMLRGTFSTGDSGVVPGHPDMMQFIGGGSATANWENITIRDNMLFGSKEPQGIFMKDMAAGYYFVATIENNLIAHYNDIGIAVDNGLKLTEMGDGTVVRGNTLVTLNPEVDQADGTGIIIGGIRSTGTITVEDNIVDKMSLNGDATYVESGNVICGNGGATIPYDDIFGTEIPQPTARSFNDAFLRFCGRGDYAGKGADLRNRTTILLDGIPLANAPDPAILSNTVSEVTTPPVGGTYALDGGVRLQDRATHASLTQAYVIEFVGTLADSTGSYAFFIGDSDQTLYLGAANGDIQFGSPGHTVEVLNDVYTEGVEQTFRFGIDPTTGVAWFTVNGTPAGLAPGVPFEYKNTGDGVTPQRSLRFFSRAAGVIGSVKRLRIWQEMAAEGQIPTGTPYAEMNGGTFVADATAAGFDLYQDDVIIN